MKRIIFTFIVGLLIFTNANAKEYTDYRYAGYEWQKKNDTEFCKYKGECGFFNVYICNSNFKLKF